MTTVADSRFEKLLSELAMKSGLAEENVLELIKEKKSSVGGGYLTQQGALFLVAADLGIIINYENNKLASLAEIARDQNSATIQCRILSVGPTRIFTRKSDSKKGIFSRAVLFDDTTRVYASLWDRSAHLLIDGSDYKPGDMIKISNAYVRPSIDGTQTINIGEKSTIEKINDEREYPQIKHLSQIILPLSSIPESGNMLAVKGKVEGEVKINNFTRSDGTTSNFTSITICDPENERARRRVVIWGSPNPIFASLKDSETVTFLNVRTKISHFNNITDVEIHGDDTTGVLEHWDDAMKWMRDLGRSDASVQEPGSDARPSKPLPFVGRLVSLRLADGKGYALLVDSQKRRIQVTASGDALNDLRHFNIDDLVVCKPDTLDPESHRATAATAKSFVKSLSKRNDIEMSKSLVSTVENLTANRIASLEVMCLTDPLNREIQSKEDGQVRRTEVTVADHTGEIKVYGWRTLARMLEGNSAGDKIFLGSIEVQAYEGKKFLVLKNYSTVEKKL
jgi:replication factor A1